MPAIRQMWLKSTKIGPKSRYFVSKLELIVIQKSRFGRIIIFKWSYNLKDGIYQHMSSIDAVLYYMHTRNKEQIEDLTYHRPGNRA